MGGIFVFCEHLVVEKNQCNDGTTDGCISKVEDGGEEDAMLSCIGEKCNFVQPFPLRHVPFHKRKVEHIHHTSQHEFAVTRSPFHELCNSWVRRVVENHAIEEAIEDVARCTCQNQGEAHDEARGCVLLDLVEDVDANENHCYDAEGGEEVFSTHFPTESHAVVLNETYLKPVCDVDAFPQIHVCLHPDLDELVEDDDKQYEGNG